MIKKFGFQAYTIRDLMQTPEGINDAFGKMKALGYDEVQTAGMICVTPEEYAKIAHDNGIKIIGTHEPFDKMRADPEAAMAMHRVLGTTNIGVGGMPMDARENADTCRRFCEQANKFAETIAKEGFKFTYHNHYFEFVRVDGNKTMMDIMFEEFDPKNISFCLDCAWVQNAGADVRYWIEKLEGRLDILHIKDVYWMKNNPKDYLMPTSIGDGNMYWKGIVESAEKVNVKYYIVEQDNNFFEGDPLKSAARSAKYIKENLM